MRQESQFNNQSYVSFASAYMFSNHDVKLTEEEEQEDVDNDGAGDYSNGIMPTSAKEVMFLPLFLGWLVGWSVC